MAGKTWISVALCPENDPGKLVIVDGVFYLSFDTVYRSTDAGKTWVAVNDGLTGEIRTLSATQNTLFAKTSTGIHRLDAGKTWIAVNDGLMDEIDRLYALQDLPEGVQEVLADEIDSLSLYALQRTLFATTTKRPGLYRLDVDSWRPLRFPVS